MVQENGLYLVLGGDLKSLEKNEFKEDSNIDIVGIFKNYDEAKAMWRAKAQSTVDNAHKCYYVLPIHEYLKQL